MPTVVVADDLAPDAASPNRKRALRAGLLAALALATYLGAALYHFAPAMTSCSTNVMGPAGDSTAGGVWLTWAFEQQGGLPFHAHTDLTAAPAGERFWQPEWWTQTLTYTPLWVLGHVTNAPCAWNVSIISGFVLSGLSMFGLVYWLTRRPVVALLFGYAFAYSAFAQMKASGNLAMVHRELIPVLLLFLIRLVNRPSIRRAVPAGVTLALLGYTDGYYLLIGWAIVAAFALGALVHRAWATRRARDVWPDVRAFLGVAFAAVLLLAPLVVAYRGNSSSIDADVSRGVSDLDVYGARPADYLLPAHDNPLFKGLFGSWQDRHLGLSNYAEKTLYLGWGTLAFAVVALVLWWRGARTDDPRRVRLPSQVVIPLCSVAFVAAVASGPAHSHMLGLTLPGPSLVVHAIAPYWRVFARLFVAVHAAVIVLAALGVAGVLAGRSNRVRVVVLAIACCVVFIDAMAARPFSYATFDYSAAPSGYRWLARQSDISVIADAPVWPNIAQPDAAFATFQPIHGKRVVNPKSSAEEGSLANSSVLGLGDPQTVPMLRSMLVDAVVVHPGLFPSGVPDTPPPGLELVRRFSFAEDAATVLSPNQARRTRSLAAWYDMDVYRLAPGPIARVAALPTRGWTVPETQGWSTQRWVQDQAELDVVRLGGDARFAQVTLTMASFGEPRTVAITQGGRELLAARVEASGPSTFTVRATVGEPLVLTPSPGPKVIKDLLPGSTDPRRVSVIVTRIDATAVDGAGG